MTTTFSFTKKAAAIVLCLLMLTSVFALQPLFATTGGTGGTGGTSGGSPYVTSYAVIDAAGNNVASVGAGQKCIIVVNIVDPRVTEAKAKDLENLDIKVTSNTNYVAPSRGDIKILQVNGAKYDGTAELQYAVMFTDIVYRGGENTLAFDIALIDNKAPLANVSVGVSNCGSTPGATVSGAKPNVMVSEIGYGTEAVRAGSVFTLSVTSTNTSTSTGINNVITELQMSDSISVAGGSNNSLTKAVAAGGKFTTTYSLKVGNNAPTGMINLTINYSFYADGATEPTTASQVVAIPVMQPDRFSFSKIETPVDLMLGNSDVMTVNFINKGKDTLYNLAASVESDGLKAAGEEQYVGNIAAGSKGSVDFDVEPTSAGTVKGKINITYENENGEVVTQTADFTFEVAEAAISGGNDFPIGGDIPLDDGSMTPSSGMPWWAWVLIGLGVTAVIVVPIVLIKKKKAKLHAEDLEDDEDEDY